MLSTEGEIYAYLAGYTSVLHPHLHIVHFHGVIQEFSALDAYSPSSLINPEKSRVQ